MGKLKLFNESESEAKSLLLKDLTQEMIDDGSKLYFIAPKSDVVCPWDNAIEKVDGNHVYVEGNIVSGGVALEHKCTLILDKSTADKYYELIVEDM